MKNEKVAKGRIIGLAGPCFVDFIVETILLTVQIQLSQCKDRISKLEAQSEDPQDKSRVRILEGKDLLPGDMHKKIEDLEIHLAVKEEQLMEKLLLLEQVSKRTGMKESKWILIK